MEKNRSSRVQKAFLEYFKTEKAKAPQQRLQEQALTPFWILQGVVSRSLKFLELGKSKEAPAIQRKPLRPPRTTPASPGMSEKFLDGITAQAVLFLQSKAKERAKLSGGWVPPLTLMVLTGKIPWLKSLLGNVLRRSKP